MSRPLRLLYPHAIYHVINRGNYRTFVFGSPGAAAAFVRCLLEAVARFKWRLHAFVVMGNHFHLVVETPEANLPEGMHWLQCTFATRFNRFRKERGHVFQGRYYAGLVQPGPALARVVNYVHLNPVRAKLVEVAGLPDYPWSSLGRFLRGPRPEGLSCADWLKEWGLSDDIEGWEAYGRILTDLAGDPEQQKAHGFGAMEGVWAIGDEDWKQDIAHSFRQVGLADAPCGPERDTLRAMRWGQVLGQALGRLGRTREDLRVARKGAPWKIALAAELRETCGANHRWLARELDMGKPASLRFLLWRLRRGRGRAESGAL